ncbi:MAG: hypothetical protein LBF16_11375 [Pseudomonadales bacterium]|jgi:hypothetical protein|nr:hypothetical protein [Pseudomonadales bacterium]
MMQELKTSSQLFGAYLHQDWADEFGSDDEAVQAMIDLELPETLVEASREIREMLSTQASDTELAAIMTDEVGCYFDPASKGQTYREWLGCVLKQWAR